MSENERRAAFARAWVEIGAAAHISEYMASHFADWPKGCIVRGPAVEPFEIDTTACYIGLESKP